MTGDAPQPIGRTALAVEVTDRLRRMILDGRLHPGDKVREKELTESFGVSRTPLREALKVLAAEGLLDLIPNRGAIVALQTGLELREIFPVLAALEALACEQAAVAASRAELDGIAALTADLRVSYERADRASYFDVNQSIHSAIMAAGKNTTLMRSHSVLAGRVQRARYQANLTPARWAQAVDEHEHISAALAARDAERAGNLMKQHMLNKLHALMAARSGDQRR